MGADSSTLKSIESLNATLDGIEKKLFVIEDVHIHHERVISQDDSIIISGKMIHCRSGVRLLCGPVLGTYGTDFARILVEVDCDGDITLNVFNVDNKLMSTRYCFTATMYMQKQVPICVHLSDLQPDTQYDIYIGGISAKETVSNYVSVHTLSVNTTALRVILAFNGRIDKLVPGESDLWEQVRDRVVYASTASPLTHSKGVGQTQPSTRVQFLCHHGNLISIESVIHNRSIQLLDLITREDSTYAEVEKTLFDIEELLKDSYRTAYANPTIRHILRRCGGIFLAGPEEAGAFTSALLSMQLPVKEITSVEELAAASRNMNSMNASTLDYTTPGNLSGSNNELMASIEINPNSLSDVHTVESDAAHHSTGSNYISKEERLLREEKERELKEPVEVKISRLTRADIIKPTTTTTATSTPAALSTPTNASDSNVLDEEAATSSSTTTMMPILGGALKRFQAAEKLSKLSRTTVQEHLRKLVVGAIIRIARRVSWSYQRQLWDENYPSLMSHDCELEVIFRQILKLQKALQVKSYLWQSLQRARQKMQKEFGNDNKALNNLNQQISMLKHDIQEVEDLLRTAAISCGELEEPFKDKRPNGACIQLGSICLVLLESNWGWIGGDQQLFYPPVKEIEIHEQIQSTLVRVLSGQSPSLEDDQLLDKMRTAVVPVKAVICLSSYPLLPFTNTLHNIIGQGDAPADQDAEVDVSDRVVHSSSLYYANNTSPGMNSLNKFQFASLDVRRILTSLAKWQQEQSDRAVLLSGPVTSYTNTNAISSSMIDSAIGYARPYAVNNHGKEITSDAEFDNPENVMFDVWNRDRSKLQQILLGDMRRATSANTSYAQNMAILQDLFQSGQEEVEVENAITVVTDTNAQFKSYYETSSRCFRRCVWDISYRSPVRGVAEYASYAAVCVHDGNSIGSRSSSSSSSSNSVSVGPVIGSVTSDSAAVLIQMTESGPIELMCIDQLSGAEYLCSRLVSAGHPVVFLFEHLLPNRAYNVLFPFTFHSGDSGEGSSSSFWGSFTTMRRRGLVKNSSVVDEPSSDERVNDHSAIRELRMTTSYNPEELFNDDDNNNNALLVGNKDRGNKSNNIIVSTSAMDTNTINSFNASKISKMLKGNSNINDSLSDLPNINSSSHHADQSSSSKHVTKGSPMTILLLGADKPSWRAILPTGTKSTFATDRMYLSSGLMLSNTISDVLSQGWSGIDLVIHCGYSVDWGTCIDAYLSIVSQAERIHGRLSDIASQLHSHNHIIGQANQAAYSYQSSIITNSTSEEQLLSEAHEKLRTACVSHWGSSPYTRSILAHGNHYFISSPVLDMLTLFHSMSVSALRSDLSTYSLQQLMRSLTTIQMEYQQQINHPLHNSNTIPSLHGLTHDHQQVPCFRYLDDGSVLLFELQPNFSFDPRSFLSIEDRLIPMTQLRALEELLFPSKLNNISDVRADSFHTIIILSPMPLVKHDILYTEYSDLSEQQLGISYSLQDVVLVLDMIAMWIEGSSVSDREAVIVCGGSSMNFSTDIFAELNLVSRGDQTTIGISKSDAANPDTDSQAAMNAQSNRQFKITQFCLGSLVGIYEGTVPPIHHNTNSTTSTSLPAEKDAGTIFSNHRKYKYIHRSSKYSLRAQCGVVEIPLREEDTTSYRPVRPSINYNKTNASMKVKMNISCTFLDQDTLKSRFLTNLIDPAATITTIKPSKVSDEPSAWSMKSNASAIKSNSSNNMNKVDSIRQRLREQVELYPILHYAIKHLAQRQGNRKDRNSMDSSTIKGITAGTDKSSNKKKADTVDTDPIIISIIRAIDVICQRNRQIFDACHVIYLQHDEFELPSGGGVAVENGLLAVVKWVLRKLSPKVRSILKAPSSFTIRVVWSYLVNECELVLMNGDAQGISKSDAAASSNVGSIINKGKVDSASVVYSRDGIRELAVDNVSASMESDSDYFYHVIKYCLELQLVIEYKAYSRGLLD